MRACGAGMADEIGANWNSDAWPRCQVLQAGPPDCQVTAALGAQPRPPEQRKAPTTASALAVTTAPFGCPGCRRAPGEMVEKTPGRPAAGLAAIVRQGIETSIACGATGHHGAVDVADQPVAAGC